MNTSALTLKIGNLKISLNKLAPVCYFFSLPCWPLISKNGLFLIGFFNFALYLLKIIRVRKLSKLTYYEIAFFLFIVLCCLQSLYSPSPNTYSLCRRMILYYLGAFASIRLIAEYETNPYDIINPLMKSFILGTLIISVYCVIVEGFSIDRLGRNVYENAGGNYIELSVCLLFSLLFIVWRMNGNGVNGLKNKSKKTYIFLFILFLIFCVLSNTRKVFVAVFLMIVFCLIWKTKLNIIKVLKYTILICMVLILAYFIITQIPFLYNLLIENVLYRFSQLLNFMQTGINTDDYSASARELVRILAIQIWNSHKLFGVGTDGFRVYNNLGNNISGLYSHCNFTELLCNNGLVGFILYYSFFVFALKKSFRLKGEYSYLKCFITSSLIILLIMDYGQVSYYYIYYITFYMLLSSLLKKAC